MTPAGSNPKTSPQTSPILYTPLAGNQLLASFLMEEMLVLQVSHNFGGKGQSRHRSAANSVGSVKEPGAAGVPQRDPTFWEDANLSTRSLYRNVSTDCDDPLLLIV
jgi:hypothetical protein